MLPQIIPILLQDPLLPLALGALLLCLYAVYLHTKIHRLTRGESGASLEKLIRTCIDSVSEMEKKNELISKHALSLDTRVSHALRNTQTIRYKAFEANGSNQSFSIALVNEKGNGVVITSLHSHTRISTFAKPIENYSSSYDLSEEELHVLEESKKEHKSNH